MDTAHLKYKFGDFVLEIQAKKLWKKGEPRRVKSYSNVMRLLIYLVEHPQGVTNDQVVKLIWPDETDKKCLSKRLKTLYNELRRALDEQPQNPARYIRRVKETGHFEWAEFKPVLLPADLQTNQEEGQVRRRDFLTIAGKSSVAAAYASDTGPAASQRSVFFADAISVQLAGELIFEIASTASERSARRHTYQRALEDVTFLILFAPQFGLAEDLPAMKDQHPGQTFLDHVSICTDNVAPPRRLNTLSAQAITGIPEHYASIGRHLDYVSKAFASFPFYYHDLLQRDAVTFLGTDKSVLRDSFRGLEAVRFGPQRKWLNDVKLQQRVGCECVSALAIGLATAFPNHHPDALRDFVSHVLVEHFARSEAYDLAARNTGDFRVPFVTRTEVRRHAINEIKPPREQRLIIDLTQAALSLALQRVLGSPRQKVLEILVDLRDEDPFQEYRKYVLEYSDAVRASDNTGAKVALSALQDLYEYGEDSNIAIDSMPRGGAFLRSIRRARGEYPVNLYRVFAELAPT